MMADITSDQTPSKGSTLKTFISGAEQRNLSPLFGEIFTGCGIASDQLSSCQVSLRLSLGFRYVFSKYRM
jgi:hypothetical protein